MARYTNYDDLIKKWHDLGLDEISKIHKVNAFNHFIKTLPIADVTEVVRCPDCIYCDEHMKCTELKDNSGHPLDVAIFDYCSQGVRKEKSDNKDI